MHGLDTILKLMVYILLLREGTLVFRMGIIWFFTDGFNRICLFLYEHLLGYICYFYYSNTMHSLEKAFVLIVCVLV